MVACTRPYNWSDWLGKKRHLNRHSLDCAAIPRSLKRSRSPAYPGTSPCDQSDAGAPGYVCCRADSRSSNQIPALPEIVVITTQNAAQANTHIADLKSQIAVLTEVLSEQVELQKTAADDQRPSIDKAIEAVNAQVERLQSEYSTLDRLFGVYLTSIKPNDRDLYLTARKASEIYPKIPYFIPGTNETGEFWVEPNVSDSGEMQFGFKFVDTDSSAEKVRETIVMSLPQIEDAQEALFKLHAWSEIAHQQKLRRNYEKRVTCFPLSECPPDGERVAGKASTEVRF